MVFFTERVPQKAMCPFRLVLSFSPPEVIEPAEMYIVKNGDSFEEIFAYKYMNLLRAWPG